MKKLKHITLTMLHCRTMKKTFLTLAILLTFAFAYGQSSMSKGNSQLNIGVGLSGWGVPVYLGMDFGTNSDFTLGAELSFRSFNERWQSNRYRHSIIGVSGNVNYHFNRVLDIPDHFDLYAGLNIGFYAWSSPDNYDGTHNSGVGIGAQIGGRYFFTDKVGVNLEFGGGNAFGGGKFGLTFKL
jgi:outer membrane immunogenic protein